MSERFIYKRGHGNKRRVNHLAGFNRLGQFAGALCGSKLDFDTSCNLPLGRRTCKRCLKVERGLSATRLSTPPSPPARQGMNDDD